MQILVTGANGFVGDAAASRLERIEGFSVRRAVRKHSERHRNAVEVGEIGPLTDWCAALDDIDAVVHTAARVHVMNDLSGDPLSEFRKVNVAGTMQLAREAASGGVKRFVYLSSVKVNGEETRLGQPFRIEDAVCSPTDPYGRSKYEAELELQELSSTSGMQVTIIRPVLVYGPGVKANFREMIRWLDRGIPLPLGAIYDNRRSLVALENLVDLITCCLTVPEAANQTFFAADGEDFSTTELLTLVAKALGKKSVLFPVPLPILRVVGVATGRRDLVQRLCGSLQVDIAKTKRTLDWAPPISTNDAILQTVEAYCAAKKQGIGL